MCMYIQKYRKKYVYVLQKAFSSHLNTEHLKLEHLTFRTLFWPVFIWTDHMIRQTIRNWNTITDIFVQFSDHHSKSWPFHNRRRLDHLNTRLVLYSDGYWLYLKLNSPLPNVWLKRPVHVAFHNWAKTMLTHVCLLSGLYHVQGLHQRFDSKNETGNHQIGQVNLGNKFTSGKNCSSFLQPFIVQDRAIRHLETGPFEIRTYCPDFTFLNKIVAICLDFKWFGSQIPDHICKPTSFGYSNGYWPHTSH